MPQAPVARLPPQVTVLSHPSRLASPAPTTPAKTATGASFAAASYSTPKAVIQPRPATPIERAGIRTGTRSGTAARSARRPAPGGIIITAMSHFRARLARRLTRRPRRRAGPCSSLVFCASDALPLPVRCCVAANNVIRKPTAAAGSGPIPTHVKPSTTPIPTVRTRFLHRPIHATNWPGAIGPPAP